MPLPDAGCDDDDDFVVVACYGYSFMFSLLLAVFLFVAGEPLPFSSGIE